MQNTFDPSSVKHERSHWNTLRQLAIHLWPAQRWNLRTRVVFAMLFLILAKVINVWVPFFLKYAIDALSVESSLLTIPVGIIVAYGLARVSVQAFGEVRDMIFVKVAQHAQRTVGLETFKHLHSLSLQFHLSRQTGGLSRVIERGTRGIQFVLHFMTFNIVPTLLELFLVTAVLFFKFNILFAAITLTTIVLYVYLTLAVTEWRTKFRQRMNKEETHANTKAVDSLLNFETVKYFGNEEHEYKQFDASLARYESAAVQSQSSLGLLNMGQGIIIGVGLVLLMYLAAKGVVEKTMTVGDFILVNTFLIQLYLPLNFLGFVYREIKQSLIDMDKMFELLDVSPDIVENKDAKELQVHQGKVMFENVVFGYSEKRTILHGISFTVSPGKTTAIVGPSGAGKSTISRLLFRFYDAQQGAISIDDQNLKDVTQHSLRMNIGIVPQDTVLFNNTIGYNIAYGKTGSSDEEIRRAAQMAKIHDFIMSLPDGYNTEVGERGLKLSGGEKQRVAIARTMLKNPKILLFDEATSALDSHTEKSIQESLKEVSKNRTTLVIAHRLSTIVDADEILVLKDGLIVERGLHRELLAKKGEYASMWKKQQQEEDARLTQGPDPV
ncbi:MAG: ABC transporter ATP-binding protein/permease [Bdellovibrionales bacterium]|nr:ABC transporter ATP-binding protein/permease [Bdellovibrionales bacterium]